MLFSEVERVIYKKNPLIEVVCQLRFPTILKIPQEPPVEFQERIRKLFPIFREKAGTGIQIPQEITALIPTEVASSLRDQPAYEFATSDDQWVVSLTRDFLALTCRNYERWEEFRQQLVKPLQALNDIYAPAFFTRIGLRYQNVIQRSVLDIEDIEWSQLVNPVLASFLGHTEFEDAVEDTTLVTLLELEEMAGKVRNRSGLVKMNQTREICFLIDNDFFKEGKEDLENGIDIIDNFNRKNHNFFRWCITSKLHRILEPESI